MLIYAILSLIRWWLWLATDRIDDKIEEIKPINTRKFYTDTHEISYPVESYDPDTGVIKWGYTSESRGGGDENGTIKQYER